MGYVADVAGNGMEVLEALRRQPYDLILMDVQMPGMDGLEATRRIRAEFPAERQPRVVALTANVLREQREACLAAGMSNKQVARRLDISIRTVTVHVSNLLRKTRSASRTEAALWAVRHRRLPGN